jgi:hypothetical protein
MRLAKSATVTEVKIWEDEVALRDEKGEEILDAKGEPVKERMVFEAELRRPESEALCKEGAIEVGRDLWLSFAAEEKDLDPRAKLTKQDIDTIPLFILEGHPLSGKRLLRVVPSGMPDLEVSETGEVLPCVINTLRDSVVSLEEKEETGENGKGELLEGENFAPRGR